jgi:phosphinothricin acetyltransferase
VSVTAAVQADRAAIEALVTASGLPLDGLAAHLDNALVVRAAGGIVGCAAMERHGRFGLLRSVAVDERGRDQGVGTALVEAAVERARATDLDEVFILTETAAPFFARLGFLPVSRPAVPADVRASLEFASVCPTSAQAMARVSGVRPGGGQDVTRAAVASDAEAIVDIYNAGIEDRLATFETALRSTRDVRAWFDGVHPTCVAVSGASEPPARVVAFASVSAYRARQCYAGVGEFSVYVDRAQRGRGLGHLAMEALIAAAARAGFWKLLSRVFVENDASRRLSARLGFREVGIYKDHARLDGEWRDVVIVERLLHDLAP